MDKEQRRKYYKDRRGTLIMLALGVAGVATLACGAEGFAIDAAGENTKDPLVSQDELDNAIESVVQSGLGTEAIAIADEQLTDLSVRDLMEALRGNFPQNENNSLDEDVQGFKTYNVKVTPNIEAELASSVIGFATTLTPVALAEPTPAGEAILLLALAGAGTLVAAQFAKEKLQLFDLNDHSIEKRGAELANYIKNIVDTAFSNPDAPNNPYKNSKRILCYAASGIVEGCDAVMHLAVEVASRKKRLVDNSIAKRTASIIFGRDTGTGEWKQITSLYFSGAGSGSNGSMEEYIRRQGLRLRKLGLNVLEGVGCTNFPPPSQLLSGAP